MSKDGWGLLLLMALTVPALASDQDAGWLPLAPDEAAPPVPEGPSRALDIGVMPEELGRLVAAGRTAPLSDRIETISHWMLEAPYTINPVGEGEGIDPDHPVRYDTWDCLTFVEEVVALALAGDPLHAGTIRQSLRYGEDERSYEGRRHFMETQWIPSALEQGWLVETTARYGPTRTLEREVSHEDWESWRGRSALSLPTARLPVGAMRLDVLPLEEALASASEFAPGSILMVVREDLPSWGPLWITHVGIVVSGSQPMMRHASRMGGRVRDHSLTWYLTYIGGYDYRPVAGVAIYEPVEQGPRRALSVAGSEGSGADSE